MNEHRLEVICNFPIQDKLMNPDRFIYFDEKKSFYRPKESFIISKSKDGKIISKYKDDIWDFGPYSTVFTEKRKLNFQLINDNDRPLTKWICFLLIFIRQSGKAGKITPSTMVDKFSLLRKITDFCHKHSISLSTFFSSKEFFKKFVYLNHSSQKTVPDLRSLVNSLYLLDPRFIDFQLPDKYLFSILKKKSQEILRNSPKQQHPIIPPRIYSNYINQLFGLLQEFNNNSQNISNLISKLNYTESYATSKYIRKDKKQIEHNFLEAIKHFNLEKYLSKYEVSTTSKLLSFLNKIQLCCKLLVTTYSGMRSSEVNNLLYDCFITENTKTGTIYKIEGATTKSFGYKKKSNWVTTNEISVAIDTAKLLANIINKNKNIPTKSLPLFINVGFLNFGYSVFRTDNPNLVSKNDFGKDGPHKLFKENAITINEEDLFFLEIVQPMTAWRNMSKFHVGENWPLTAHQLRRSLAFYIVQSGLVSFPSLKRQLKHVTNEMTFYYSNGSGLHGNHLFQNDFKNLIDTYKKNNQSSSYLLELLFSNEKIHGAHGVTVERLKNEFKDKQIIDIKKHLIEEFNQGRISYKPTPLGACTSREPCNKRALRSVYSCLDCKSAAIVPTKLDKVINKQNDLINKLSKNEENSIALKLEKEDLKQLVKFKKKIEKRNVEIK